MVTKLYCYVDETGQDTKGDIFLVSVVITQEDRQEISEQLIRVEEKSGKGNVKWNDAEENLKKTYIRQVLKLRSLRGKLSYSVYPGTKDYLSRTVLTTARAITSFSKENYKAIVFVDGLQKSKIRWFGSELRHLQIRTEKVRGVRKEETEPLLRLADALCGFIRVSLTKRREEFSHLLMKAKRNGMIKEL